MKYKPLCDCYDCYYDWYGKEKPRITWTKEDEDKARRYNQCQSK